MGKVPERNASRKPGGGKVIHQNKLDCLVKPFCCSAFHVYFILVLQSDTMIYFVHSVCLIFIKSFTL